MKILMVTSEMDGIVKTGGLADFAGALPKALIERGHDVRVVLPMYKSALVSLAGDKGGTLWAEVKSEPLYFNLNHSDRYGCSVHHIQLGNAAVTPATTPVTSVTIPVIPTTTPVTPTAIPVRLVEHHDFFSRDGIYGYDIEPYPDNALRYAFLCKAALEQCLNEQWIPDIVHCNDWQTAITPYFLKEHYLNSPQFKNTKSLLTIHNGDYQGKTDIKWLDSLGIMPQRFTSELMEEYGLLNLLKCGIMYADAINAVSPGYCQELLQPETSHNNLWHYLNKRRDKFKGVLNGCDYTLWNPKIDPFLPHHFSAQNMGGKDLCKRALQARMNLPEKSNLPLLGLVSRLTAQKGFDYLIPALERLLYEDAPVQLALLGSGEPDYASRLHHLQQRYPHKMSFVNGYDNGLSHLIEAGSDFFMMPSLFEPCGLNQLYSLAYGTLPIIRETGGLKDTVIGLDMEQGVAIQSGATGISFNYPDSHSCYSGLQQAILLYQENKPIYLEMQQRAMRQLFTWEESAMEYEMLYQTMLM